MTALSRGLVGEVRAHPTRSWSVAVRMVTNGAVLRPWLELDASRADGWWFARDSEVADWRPSGAVPGTPAAAASSATDDASIADHLMRSWLNGDVHLPEGELVAEVRAKAQAEGLLPLGADCD